MRVQEVVEQVGADRIEPPPARRAGPVTVCSINVALGFLRRVELEAILTVDRLVAVMLEAELPADGTRKLRKVTADGVRLRRVGRLQIRRARRFEDELPAARLRRRDEILIGIVDLVVKIGRASCR